MHTFLGCTYNYQDFAQTQKNFARSHDRETVTFRNSGERQLKQFKTTLSLCLKHVKKD